MSTMNENLTRVNDVEQMALDSLLRGGMRGDSLYSEAEYHCQGYNPVGISGQQDVIICCKIKVNQAGNRRFTFTLNGRVIARHKIALRLGELGV